MVKHAYQLPRHFETWNKTYHNVKYQRINIGHQILDYRKKMLGPIFNFLSFFAVKLDLYLFALKDKIYDTFLVDVGIN